MRFAVVTLRARNFILIAPAYLATIHASARMTNMAKTLHPTDTALQVWHMVSTPSCKYPSPRRNSMPVHRPVYGWVCLLRRIPPPPFVICHYCFVCAACVYGLWHGGRGEEGGYNWLLLPHSFYVDNPFTHWLCVSPVPTQVPVLFITSKVWIPHLLWDILAVIVVGHMTSRSRHKLFFSLF